MWGYEFGEHFSSDEEIYACVIPVIRCYLCTFLLRNLMYRPCSCLPTSKSLDVIPEIGNLRFLWRVKM
jgi:hypothetical protein